MLCKDDHTDNTKKKKTVKFSFNGHLVIDTRQDCSSQQVASCYLFLPLTNSNKEADNEVKHSKVEMLCREGVRAETWDVLMISMFQVGNQGLDSSRKSPILK